MYVEVVTSIETRKLDRTFTYEVPENLEKGIFVGQNVLVPFGRSNKETSAVIVRILDYFNISGIKVKKILALDSARTDLDIKMLSLATKIADRYFLPLSSILNLMSIKKHEARESFEDKVLTITDKGREVLSKARKSQKKDILSLVEETGKIDYQYLKEKEYKKSLIKQLILDGCLQTESRQKTFRKIELSHKQEGVYQEIEKNLNSDEKKVFLLFGATGSGKTEIYFKAIQECLRQNKQAIVLLPEINLTEQMIERFEDNFKDNVVKWHSQVTVMQKRNAWEELLKKEKNILIGPRSAIFTRMAEIGLIIVDEEHDNSYYQQNFPSYNGREVAIMRGIEEKATVILGSATPSVESMELSNEGIYKLLRLDERFYGQKNPDVHLVDMSSELHKGNSSIISDELDLSIRNKIEGGEQILIFINRRGYYNFLMCRDCGNVIKCSNCEIPLAYHEKDNTLLCHYCEAKSERPPECPHCKSRRIRGIGLGTEQAVEIIRKKYPNLSVERLDSDIKGGSARKNNIIQDYKDKKIDILVGTQIIAKGIDFPNVGLVGILLGDMSLNFPDYRAREWTFQLLMQVIGRTSRRDKKGDVILQTYRPSDIIYSDIKYFNFENFYKHELNFRKRHNYPPFGELLILEFTGEDREALIRFIWEGYERLSKHFSVNEIYKPKPSRIEKHKNLYRWQIMIKCDKKKMKETEAHIREYMEDHYQKNNQKEKIYIERNPYGLI